MKDFSDVGLKANLKAGAVSGIFLLLTSILVVFFTRSWNLGVQRLFLASVLIVFCSSFATPGILRTANHMKEFNSYDFALISVFAALLYGINFFTILLPSFLFYLIPSASGLVFYFPGAIVLGVANIYVEKPGSSFLLVFTYGILSLFFSPNFFWLSYFLAWGGIVETYGYITSSLRSSFTSFFQGIVFGSTGAGFTLLFMLVAWGRWYPLWMSLPAILLDGGLGGLGSFVSQNIGRKAKNITF